MNAVPFQPAMILAILPELMLVLLAPIVLTVDLLARDRHQTLLGWLTAGGMTLAAIAGILFSQPGVEGQLIFGGMLRHDWVSFVFRIVFLAGGALTALVAADTPRNRFGDFCALLVVAVLGMDLMAASANLIMLYLAMETTSLPLYILAGSHVYDQKSVEAGLKYLLYGAMASAVMLYGFSLLFGFSGTTDLYSLARAAQNRATPGLLMGGAALIVLVGFGFKISAVPFHFWAPDVYEGAPSPVAGFLSTASKAAGFAVLARFMPVVFPAVTPLWTAALAALAVASMLIGNVLALSQRNIKRLLAYSSIAQAGYILVGLAAGNELGRAGMVYYLASYLVSNLAAFAIVWLVGKEVGSDDLNAYAGLSKRNPGLALALLAALLSLGGIPPLSGFFGKILVFGAAVQAGQWWLAMIGALASVIGLYYYLLVIKILYRPGLDEKPIVQPVQWRLAILVCVAGMLVLGVVFGPLYGWSTVAAMGIF